MYFEETSSTDSWSGEHQDHKTHGTGLHGFSVPRTIKGRP